VPVSLQASPPTKNGGPAQQIDEVEREIKLRESAIQSYGRTEKMRFSEAEFHIARMKAVLTTLRWLQANEAKIRAAITKATNDPAEK
jgi:hypothetical protein